MRLAICAVGPRQQPDTPLGRECVVSHGLPKDGHAQRGALQEGQSDRVRNSDSEILTFQSA